MLAPCAFAAGLRWARRLGGCPLQYMAHRVRQGMLERATLLWNLRQARGMVALLVSMTAKAQAAQNKAASEQDAVRLQLQAQGVDGQEVGTASCLPVAVTNAVQGCFWVWQGRPHICVSLLCRRSSFLRSTASALPSSRRRRCARPSSPSTRSAACSSSAS